MDSPFGRTRPVQASWPTLTCYGCGPANESGLHIESYFGDDPGTLVTTIVPNEVFNAGAPNVMYGGHIAALVDCHSIWTAITNAYVAEDRALDTDPQISYVTGELSVKYLRPTPLDEPITVRAWVEGDVGDRMWVESELGPAGDVTARGSVHAVRVDPPVDDSHHEA